MKHLNQILLAFLMLVAFQTSAQTVETQINQAVEASFTMQSLQPLQNQYKQIPKKGAYWQAYNTFYQAIVAMHALHNEKISVQKVEKAKDILKQLPEKSSEDYTLLAYIHSFSMQFLTEKEELEAAENEFFSYLNKALELNANNPRTYFVKGVYDSYKPIEYGGGQTAKADLLKAKALFQKDNSPLQWGRKEVNIYINKMNAKTK